MFCFEIKNLCLQCLLKGKVSRINRLWPVGFCPHCGRMAMGKQRSVQGVTRASQRQNC